MSTTTTHDLEEPTPEREHASAILSLTEHDEFWLKLTADDTSLLGTVTETVHCPPSALYQTHGYYHVLFKTYRETLAIDLEYDETPDGRATTRKLELFLVHRDEWLVPLDTEIERLHNRK